jgi:aspartate carbamoyltransferase catalytic subunit
MKKSETLQQSIKCNVGITADVIVQRYRSVAVISGIARESTCTRNSNGGVGPHRKFLGESSVQTEDADDDNESDD